MCDSPFALGTCFRIQKYTLYVLCDNGDERRDATAAPPSWKAQKHPANDLHTNWPRATRVSFYIVIIAARPPRIHNIIVRSRCERTFIWRGGTSDACLLMPQHFLSLVLSMYVWIREFRRIPINDNTVDYFLFFFLLSLVFGIPVEGRTICTNRTAPLLPLYSTRYLHDCTLVRVGTNNTQYSTIKSTISTTIHTYCVGTIAKGRTPAHLSAISSYETCAYKRTYFVFIITYYFYVYSREWTLCRKESIHVYAPDGLIFSNACRYQDTTGQARFFLCV